jgi:hypothetical protein
MGLTLKIVCFNRDNQFDAYISLMKQYIQEKVILNLIQDLWASHIRCFCIKIAGRSPQ